MPTRTATTAYGEVEYETVECDSCNNEVAQEKATEFIIGDIKQKSSWSHDSYAKFKIYDKGRYRGTLCPYCADTKHIAADRSARSANMRDLPRAIWSAHRTIVNVMVTNLSGEDADDDFVLGFCVLVLYIMALILVGALVSSLVGGVVTAL